MYGADIWQEKSAGAREPLRFDFFVLRKNQTP